MEPVEQIEWMEQVDRKHLFDLADLMWPSEMNNKEVLEQVYACTNNMLKVVYVNKQNSP